MSTQVRRLLEPKWCSEYVLNTYPNSEHRFGVPLGPTLPGLAESMGTQKAIRVSRPWRPEADALVIQPDLSILIEAKIFKWFDGLSKLPVYKALIPSTPELQHVKDRPVEMQLLLVRPLPAAIEAAKVQNIKIVEWAPPWIIRAWEDQDKYWTPDAVARRDERKKVLAKLGFQ